ncbi:zinc ABC transporter substrate-binding protein [Acetobacterium paludosum]|uniref:Zinc ABC transporter substrate-binding protein n=2 Tax=Acetobacterium paludosum TaxID=52693 RepID=A0A923I185_9FIRM|nr:zinc ABC transporter substrate-binding protein [Acetobacterium paludosum]
MLFISIAVLSGCASNSTQTNSETSSTKDGFTIVTSFYPMYVETINVAKDIPNVQVINMTEPQTGCLHDYQLKPQDLITLNSADAFVVNGAGMETFLDDVIKQDKDLKIVNASDGIDLIKDASGEDNAHVWVSISNCITQVKNIAEQLSVIDPKNAEAYQSNADAYIAKLEALKEKMHASLDMVSNRNIITFHEAFPYFAEEFNLNIVDVIERDPGTTPSPKELEDTINIVKESKVKALFAEPQYPAEAAQTIANETGAKVYSLDPGVTGTADETAYDAYLNVMESNLKSLEEALK